MSSRLPHLTAFVPNGDDRQETAVLLVGTAEEFGLPASDVFATQDGFYISEDLADVLGGEDLEETSEPTPVVEESTTKNASGNRAAKKNTTQKE